MQTPNFNQQLNKTNSAFTRLNSPNAPKKIQPNQQITQCQTSFENNSSAFETARKAPFGTRKSLFNQMIDTGLSNQEDSSPNMLAQQSSEFKTKQENTSPLPDNIHGFMSSIRLSSACTNEISREIQYTNDSINNNNNHKQQVCSSILDISVNEESSLFQIGFQACRQTTSQAEICQNNIDDVNEESKQQQIVQASSCKSSLSLQFTSKEEFDSSIATNQVEQQQPDQPLRRRRRLADAYKQQPQVEQSRVQEEHKFLEDVILDRKEFKQTELARFHKAQFQAEHQSATIDLIVNQKNQEEQKNQIVQPLHQKRSSQTQTQQQQQQQQSNSDYQILGLRRRKTIKHSNQKSAQNQISQTKPKPFDYKKLNDRNGKTLEFPVFLESETGLAVQLCQRHQINTKADDDCDTDTDVMSGALGQCQNDFEEFIDSINHVRKQSDLRNLSKNYEIYQRIKFPGLYDRNGNYKGDGVKQDSLMDETQQHLIRETYSER